MTRITIIVSMTLALVVLLAGCANPAKRLDADARTCEAAVRNGLLDVAEETCRGALDEGEDDILAPAVRSQRLFNLARILRQRGKYAEAGDRLSESLAIEETLSGADGPGVTRRQVEMTLILAGQGQWQQGAQVLERILPRAQQLTVKERRALGYIIKRYAARLRKMDKAAQAARLEAAALMNLE